ncbi:MAG: YncE family protein, partial [Candidatus Acidiferrum sp.]
MKSKLLAAIGICIILCVGSSAQNAPKTKTRRTQPAKSPLKLLQSIPLPALKAGDFDHFAIDLDGHRLFLTAEENGKLLVFDTNENKLIHTIEDLKAPHAVLYRKELNKLFVVDG